MTEMLDRWRDPVFDETHRQVPAPLAARLTAMADEVHGRHIYYERMHALLAVAGCARATVAPSEQRLGSAFGQAFHQGCNLEDVALAAALPPDQVIAIGKRTIRRTDWLKRL
jgi:hypothetical protein